MEEPEEFTDLAAAIRGARKRAGLTQEEAAARTRHPNVTQRAWQDWERGMGDAVKNVPNVEQALGLPAGFFSAQLTVLERLFTLEERLARIELSTEETKESLRDLQGFLRSIKW